jgi:hypothetical protein
MTDHEFQEDSRPFPGMIRSAGGIIPAKCEHQPEALAPRVPLGLVVFGSGDVDEVTHALCARAFPVQVHAPSAASATSPANRIQP